MFFLFMVSPANAAFFVVSADTPVLRFSCLSTFLLFRAESKYSYLCYLLSGVFLGLACLSKYFAMLLGLSYLIYLLSVRKDAARVKGFLLLALGAFPFVVQNVVWNYRTGWPNVMHNLLNRFRHHSNPVLNLLCLGVFLTYLITPTVLYFLFKNRRRILRNLRQESFRIFAVISLVPLCVFFVLSFKRTVRPHWYLSFLPFAYVMVALLLDNNQLGSV